MRLKKVKKKRIPKAMNNSWGSYHNGIRKNREISGYYMSMLNRILSKTFEILKVTKINLKIDNFNRHN